MDSPTIAFDRGGTFTDVVTLRADGTIGAQKVLSQTDLIELVLEESIYEMLEFRRHTRLGGILHATTVASNALLEQNGARIGLLTTQGFRDELEIRRGSRPSIYDFDWQRTQPLIERRLRYEVPERTSASGCIERPLDVEATRGALEQLGRVGISALAVCFVNSYANPEHERQAVALAKEVLPSVLVCASYEILPQPREYERVSTTAVNAYLLPAMGEYLQQANERFGKFADAFAVMGSNGGLMTIASAQRNPVRMVESGPAAGVLAAAALCHELGLHRAVSLDMGGTTVKASLLENAQPAERAEYEVGGQANMAERYAHGAGHTIAVPTLDIVEAGAGGGSIAYLEDGMLRVGPRSAGADPGPAAYLKGGNLPTVTDANIALGFINPSAIAGGSLEVSRDAAIKAIDEHLASRLNMGVLDIAVGIRQVANAAMLRSVRAVTSERGRDPREYTMIAFGGSGPVHAAELAEMAGMERVYIPPLPGLFSAVGLMLSDLRSDYVKAVNVSLGEDDVSSRLASAYRDLKFAAERDAGNDGIDLGRLRLAKFVDVRYAGQSYETVIEMPNELATDDFAAHIGRAFSREHESRYGYQCANEPIRITAVRLKSTAPGRAVSLQEIGRAWLAEASTPPEAERTVYFGARHGALRARVLSRKHLTSEESWGPLIVEEPSTTVVVPPGWCAKLHSSGTIVLRK